LKYGVVPSPILNLVTVKVWIWLLVLTSLYHVLSLTQSVSHLILCDLLGSPPFSRYSLKMLPRTYSVTPNSTQCITPMQTLSKVNPGQLNSGLTVDPASLCALQKKHQACILRSSMWHLLKSPSMALYHKM
jgi:hypothetical protein